MTIPRSYRKSQEQLLQSFSAIDIANGIGYVPYYLIAPTGGQGLITTSDITGTNMYVDNDTETETFEIEIGRTLTITGTVYSQIAVSTSFNNTVLSCGLYKYDGSSETTIGTSSNKTVTTAGNYKEAFKIEATETILNQGDILRFKITSNQNNTYIICDPSDSAVTTPNGACTLTQSKVIVPYHIIL